MKVNFKAVFIGVALVGMFLLGKQCGNTTINSPGKTITITKVDTIYRDTGSVKMVEKRVLVPVKEYYVEKLDSQALANAYKVRVYDEIYSSADSTVQVNVKDSILGYLLKQHVSYKLSGIKQINTTTSNTITVPIPTPMKYQFALGIQATPRGLSGQAELTVKKTQYGIGYDPFNKAPNISLKYIIFRK